MQKSLNSRATAAIILADLLNSKGSLSTALSKLRDRPDYSLIQELSFGCCRWYWLIQSQLNHFLSRPLRTKDCDIRCLLTIGIYQIREMKVANYALINETVEAARELNKPWATGLINGVLRAYLRGEKIKTFEDPTCASAHPEWLYRSIKAQWPAQAESILDANNLRPPMTLRINVQKISQTSYLDLLKEQSITASVGRTKTAVVLDTPCKVDLLPNFEEGFVSIQDEASQYVPEILDLKPNLRVLDACAAPGGKTCHMLEYEPSLKVTAVDINKNRMQRLKDNLKRQNLSADILIADVKNIKNWWDEQRFDRILLDAPCSGTGVIRRHPDIKVLRTYDEVLTSIEIQKQLLQSLWNCLRSGGLLLYTTCSILQEENQLQIRDFLKSTNTAKCESIEIEWGVECKYGRQFLPEVPTNNQNPDGFFFSLLRKT